MTDSSSSPKSTGLNSPDMGSAPASPSQRTPESGIPTFVVVGNVNQGKSSIVATLAENSAIPIASHAGTTTRSGTYAFRIDDRDVFRLVDTPGFQQARKTLHWLKQHASSPAERVHAVEAFLREHRDDEAFHDETELLTPILGGAGILYVVDASARFQPSNEAEMEILRWTGQPGMALLNRTRERDFADEWRPILEQFFNIVREFDAHHATFGDRIELLAGFRAVQSSSQPALDEAIHALTDDWRRRTESAAAILAELMIDALRHVEKRALKERECTEIAKTELTDRYRSHHRGIEQRARQAIEQIYRHRVDRAESELDVLDEDLFSDASLRLFGLTRNQLAKHGAAWGAIAGGAIDLMVGGASFFAGAGIGAGVGALSGWFGGHEVARIGGRNRLAAAFFPGDIGRFVYIGPVTNPTYAWLLLDRALLHHRAIRHRAHARQDAIDLAEITRPLNADPSSPTEERTGVVHQLPTEVRKHLDKSLRSVLEAKDGKVDDNLRTLLQQALLTAFDSVATE